MSIIVYNRLEGKSGVLYGLDKVDWRMRNQPEIEAKLGLVLSVSLRQS
jgi:hypothetical protein